MIFNFEEFIRENINNEVILYRGDSQYIENFDADKFDPRAIYGIGLYLTDNKRVAYTYTIKGDHSSVIAELEPGSKKLKDAELYFVIVILCADMIPDEQERYDLYNTLKWEKYYKDLYDRYKRGIKLFWLSDEYISKMSDEKKMEYEQDIEEEIEKLEKSISELDLIHKKYDNTIEKTKEYFIKNRKKWNFLPDGDEYWKVISNEANKGYISIFSVDKNIIDSCYNANKEVNEDIKNILRRMVRKYLSSSKIKQYLEKHYYQKERFSWKNFAFDTTYAGDPFTLSNFFYNNTEFRDKETHFDIVVWEFFKTEMKKMGYTGIKYDGGEHLNSPIKHTSYVFWDLTDINRIK